MKKEYIRSLVTFLIIIVGLFMGIIPAARSIFAMMNKQKTVANKIEALEKKKIILETINANELKTQLLELVDAVPLDRSLPSLLTTLDGVSAQTGVSVLDVALLGGALASDSAKKSSVHTSGASVVPFTISIEGTKDQIQAFFALVARTRRLMGIRNFDVVATAADRMQAKVEMDTYFLPLPGTIGTAKEVITPLSEKDEAIIAKISALPNLSRSIDVVAIEDTGIKIDPFSP